MTRALGWDVFVAAATGVLLASATALTGWPEGAVPFAVVLPALLIGRRARPLLTLCAMVVVICVQWVVVEALVPSDAAVLAALQSVVARASVRVALGAAVVAAWGAVAAAMIPNARLPVDGSDARAAVLSAAFYLFAATAAVAIGAYQRQRRRTLEALEERLRRTEVEREHAAQLAAMKERERIAREVHDVVGHALAVIAVQAQSGAFAAGAEPAAAPAALDAIAVTAKEALGEVRGVLSMLGPESVDGLEIQGLVGRLRAGGVDVEVQEHGAPWRLPASDAHALRRVLQEALTNVVKHGGTGSRATVRLDWETSQVAVEVRNTFTPGVQAEAESQGRGIAGMRRRLADRGGRLDAGPRSDGTFVVRALLPVTPST